MLVLTRTKGIAGKIRNVIHKCNTNYITDISIILVRDFQVLVRKIMILFFFKSSFYFLVLMYLLLLNHAK